MERVIPIRPITMKEYREEKKRELEKLNKTLNNPYVTLPPDHYEVIRKKIAAIEKELTQWGTS